MFAVDDIEWVPESLDTMEPGHELACVLSTINVYECTAHDRIRVLKAYERMRSFYSAHLYSAMNAVAAAVDPEDTVYLQAEEIAAVEVGTALKWTRRTAENEMEFAVDLRSRLPRVWSALFEGRIDVRRAKVMVHATTHLSPPAARTVVDAIIDSAHRYTTGQLGARIRKLCIDANPEDAKQRYESAVEQRRVTTQADEDGTAGIFALDLPPDRAGAAMSRINRLARELLGDGETRTIDQLRADVFLDLLIGHRQATGSGRGTVHLHADLPTLAKLSESAGELGGYGPVISDITRQVAEQQQDSSWPWTVYDGETGAPVATGTTRRRPTAGQQREVLAANPTCIFPGCRMPAADCDIDHRVRWADSRETHTEDLAPLCRRHHRFKDEGGWSYRRLTPAEPGDDSSTVGLDRLPEPIEARRSDYLFTSPLGHIYTTSGRSP